MRTTLTLLVLLLVAGLHAQVITRLHNGSSTFYYAEQLHVVVAAAFDGDTIILPGGPVATAGINLNKTITFIGAGVLGSGTPVTGKTIIPYAFNMDIVIQQGSEGSSFHGVDFQRPVSFTGDVSNVGFTRCAFDQFPMAGFNMAAPSNVHIKHCIFREGITNGGNSAPQGLVIENSILEGGLNFGLTHVATAVVTNCVILDMTTFNGYNQGVAFTNNIFTRVAATFELNSASSYSCNLFCMTGGNALNWAGATDLGNNLGWQIAGNNVFVNVPMTDDFNELYDYHLAVGSPGLLGTMPCVQGEAGIHGGSSPWKEGAIPFNPHWISLSPALGGTNGGAINVNLSGTAQQD